MLLCSATAIGVFVGCASAPKEPTATEKLAADYGPYPSDYKEQIQAGFRKTLKDPSSAQYDWGAPPYKGWQIMNKTTEYGYFADVSVNAKNSFGAFIGFQKYHFFFHQGKLNPLPLVADWVQVRSGT